jgi:chromosome segregation ATPase
MPLMRPMDNTLDQLRDYQSQVLADLGRLRTDMQEFREGLARTEKTLADLQQAQKFDEEVEERLRQRITGLAARLSQAEERLKRSITSDQSVLLAQTNQIIALQHDMMHLTLMQGDRPDEP